MRRNRFGSLLCLWAACATALGSCRTPAPATPPPAPAIGAAPLATPVTAGTSTRPQVAIDVAAPSGAFSIELPDGKASSPSVVATPLPATDTQALLARLEPLPDLSADNAAAPTLRPPSLAPVRNGAVQPIAFVEPGGKPASDAPPATPITTTRPLAAPQISPQGAVRAESEIRIRFSEAMVPVAQVDTVVQPPATIAPAIAGTWRWIDTRVLVFTATAARFAQATEYTVTVRAGTGALSGAKLPAETTATFTTPGVAIAGTYPAQMLRPDSAIAVRFDQDIDPQQILPRLKFTRHGKNQAIAVRAVTLAEAQASWAKHPEIKFDVAKANAWLGAHHVIVAPVTTWPAGIEGQITLAAGAPSREGPRKSDDASFGNFDVAPPFTLLGVACWNVEVPRLAGAKCPAKSYVEVRLSNPIALASYRADKIQIQGEKFEDNAPSGNSVGIIAPETVGRTFTVVVGDGLVDTYGQPFVGPRRASFGTGPVRFDPYVSVPTGLVVLDPRFEIPQWLIRAQAVSSVRVQLFQVTPKDYFAYEDYEAGKRTAPPGRRIHDKTYTIGARNGGELRVDLRPALTHGIGHVIATAAFTAAPGQPLEHWMADQSGKQSAWIQVTKLALSARQDADKIQGWVHDITPSRFLSTVPNVATTIIVEGRGANPTASTDATGHTTLALLDPVAYDPDRQRPSAILLAQHSGDSTFAAISGNYEKSIRRNDARWYVTDDRFTYKPGEPVYLKGWVRWTHNGVNPDLALPAANDVIEYTLQDSRNNRLASGTAPISDHGGFDLEVVLPQNVNLGTAQFRLSTRNRTTAITHTISIQEFRTPAYAVTLNDDVSHGGAAPLYVGESIEMNAAARYYAGGGLAGAGVKWDATLEPVTFRPPGWSTYTFTPPGPRSEDQYYSWRHRSRKPTLSTTHEGALSAASNASIAIGIAALPDNHRPAVLEVDATVTDVDRYSIRASSRPILVHPSMYYVGIRQRPGHESVLQLIVSDLDGNLVRGVPVAVEIEGVLGSERYRDDAKVVDTQRCEVVSDVAPVLCTWKRGAIENAYTATAKIADARGRTNASRYHIPWWASDERKADLVVVPDKKNYKPGDVAKLEIRSTVTPATAVVTFARQGIIAQKRVDLTTASTTVELPIEPAFIQNVHVVIDRWGSKRQQQDPTQKLPLPEHTSTQIDLPVDIEGARLEMRTRPLAPLVEPGAEATFEVEVRHDDKPKEGAEVALMVVDEAVLALSSRTYLDPLAPFYRQVDDGTSGMSTMALVDDAGEGLAGAPGFRRYKLEEEGGWGFGRGGFGSGGGGMGMGTIGTVGHGGVVAARKDLRATAVFSPRLRTDANGKVQLTVKMPESLTRFRIVAFATSDTRNFGKAESNIVTQRKLNARTVAPRFLTQGDVFSLPVVVQNLDTAPRTIDVAVRAANLEARGPAGKRVTIRGGQRAEIRFDFATRARGRAVVQTIVTSGAFADSTQLEVPIYEPATTESFATYGVVDDAPQFEQLAVPAELFRDVGGLEVELASTQLQSLTDAYWYLYAYPYECAEQRSARMLASAAMHDILDAFATPGRPSKKEIDATLANDVAKLRKEQAADGGWGYFMGMRSDPYVTMQVLSALGAQRVKADVTARASAFVTKEANTQLAKLEKTAATPAAQRARDDRDQASFRVALAAAALSALATTGTDVRPRTRRLHAAATTLRAYPVDAKARVLSILANDAASAETRDKLLGELISATHETAGAATVTAQYVESERLLLVSSYKTTALALDAIMREAPQHPLVTKLARGILEGRKRGRWMSTQENLVVLTTMRRYFDTYEKTTPNYTGKVWVGNAGYAEQAFVGRSTARAATQVDWTTLAPGSTHDLALVKNGPGRMYYRVGITYAPKQTNLPALDAGFLVRRSYRAVDDPKDVVKEPDGRVKVRLGARVLVTVEAINTTKRHAVAVVDPLPAGFEAVNDALAIAERPADVDDSRWDHRNLRDNRSEAFAMSLGEGNHRFSYTARATTPGVFIAAPAKAEEMYSPETFGRSAGQTIVIE